MHTLYDAPGQTCRITVAEAEATRYLMLDGCEEGAMDLASEAPVFLYLWFHKCSVLAAHSRRLLVLGAGAFTAAKCLALDYPAAAIDAVDMEPRLESVGRRFFRLDRSEFAHIAFHGLPAEEFLPAAREPYDFVFDDLFDGCEHVPTSSRTGEHFRQLRRALPDGGVCVKNLIWNPHIADTRAACEEAAAALIEVFPRYAVLALGPPHRGHNRLLIGAKGATALDWGAMRPRLAAAGVPVELLDKVELLRSA
jgi:spermidine synthase